MKWTLRPWAMTVAACAAASLLAQVAFGRVGWNTPFMVVVQDAFSSFVFSVCCATYCIVALPRVAPRIFRAVRAPYPWAILGGVLVLLATAGSFTGMLVFMSLGLISPRSLVPVWLGEPLRVSIVCTLLFGMFFTVVEHLRSRLDATTIALRTKERDEAEARRLAAEAQLASLESRVQPHFLFNTLNSIAALIVDDPGAAERMTGQLAVLLRSSLDQASPLIALEDELRIVRTYLEIERVRFGTRLRYDVTVDEDARAARVPQLAVQTIVENSVKYAVSPRREGGTIAVHAAAKNGHVEIAVADDGPGFDPATAVPGHGLALVRGRLAMSLGERARLDVDSRPGRTNVTIQVPA